MINRFLNIKFVTLNIVFLLFFTNITNALTDAKIVFKIDNEIVTNFDIDKDVSIIDETGHFPYFENNNELNHLLLKLVNDFN